MELVCLGESSTKAPSWKHSYSPSRHRTCWCFDFGCLSFQNGEKQISILNITRVSGLLLQQHRLRQMAIILGNVCQLLGEISLCVSFFITRVTLHVGGILWKLKLGWEKYLVWGHEVVSKAMKLENLLLQSSFLRLQIQALFIYHLVSENRVKYNTIK